MRDKIKLVSTALLHDDQEQAHDAGKVGDEKVRPDRTQACPLQGSQDQVIALDRAV